jgi:hypothetical protein
MKFYPPGATKIQYLKKYIDLKIPIFARPDPVGLHF